MWFDVRVVTRRFASAPAPAPPMEAYFALHPGMSSDNLEVAMRQPSEPDLAVEFSICRAEGKASYGPHPSALLGEVPAKWVLDTGDAVLRRWQSIEFDPELAEFMVFTACRVWLFSEEQRHAGKSEAAQWVLKQDPSLEVVRVALEHRWGNGATAIREEALRNLLRIVRRQIAFTSS